MDEPVPSQDLAVDGSLHELEEFLLNGECPVAIGWGSMLVNGLTPRDLLVLALSVLERLKLRGVIIGGWAQLDQLGKQLIDSGNLQDVPARQAKKLARYALENVCFIGSVPHAWLFPRCSCVVHHGGAGTTHAALLAGKPSVITPVFFDQFDYAKRITELGAGFGFQKSLPHVTVDDLGGAIQEARARPPSPALIQQIRAERGVATAADTIDVFTLQRLGINPEVRVPKLARLKRRHTIGLPKLVLK